MRSRLLALSGAIGAIATAGAVSVAAQRDAELRPTFNKDVAPIVFNNCANCHRPNQVAPMSLMSYREVRPWARAIKTKVATGEMPPWFADPRYGEFRNERRLTPAQIKTITAWVDAGAPEGDTPLAAKLPDFKEGWTHPSGRPPDLVVDIAEPFVVPAEGELPNFTIYQELPPELKTGGTLPGSHSAHPRGITGRPSCKFRRQHAPREESWRWRGMAGRTGHLRSLA